MIMKLQRAAAFEAKMLDNELSGNIYQERFPRNHCSILAEFNLEKLNLGCSVGRKRKGFQ